jgi:hypothetical protein
MASARKQTDAYVFWHYGLTSYHCLEKESANTVLRVRRIIGSKSPLPEEYKCPSVTSSEAELATGAGSADTLAVLWVVRRIGAAKDYRLKGHVGIKKAYTQLNQ